MEAPTSTTRARLDVSSPRLLTHRAVVIMCLYGLFLMIPVLLALMAVSVLQFGVRTWLLPLLVLGGVTALLPFGFGNTYAAKLARSLSSASASAGERFLVQITLAPRLRSGLRALIEDADDIGWLSLEDSGLAFRGDSIDLFIPYSQIQRVRAGSIGMRGLFLYPSLCLDVKDFSSYSALKFAERGAWFLPATRRASRKLASQLRGRTEAGRQ